MGLTYFSVSYLLILRIPVLQFEAFLWIFVRRRGSVRKQGRSQNKMFGEQTQILGIKWDKLTPLLLTSHLKIFLGEGGEACACGRCPQPPLTAVCTSEFKSVKLNTQLMKWTIGIDEIHLEFVNKKKHPIIQVSNRSVVSLLRRPFANEEKSSSKYDRDSQQAFLLHRLTRNEIWSVALWIVEKEILW